MRCAGCGQNFPSTLALEFHMEESVRCEQFIEDEIEPRETYVEEEL